MSKCIAAPRYRFFIPFAPDLTARVKALSVVTGSDGLPATREDFRYEVVMGTSDTVALPSDVRPLSVLDINVYVDTVLYENPIGPVADGVTDYQGYTWDSESNSIVFRNFVYDTWSNSQPAAGAMLRIDITSTVARKAFSRILIPRQYRVQGATIFDPQILNPLVFGINQFQGGYRCDPQIVKAANHGTAKVSVDRLGLEYMPDAGYRGLDSFSYRFVSALEQQSNAACVNITVGG